MDIRQLPADFDLTYTSAGRSPGVHVSAILREIGIRLGTLKPEDKDDIDWTLQRYRILRGDNPVGFPAMFNRVALGLAWEEWYGAHSRLPDGMRINFHPCELSEDGIIGTPDGLDYLADGTGIIHEIKCTWKSSRDHESAADRIAREWMWLAQAKSYCYLAGDEFLQAMLHVYWVNGNYRGSGPQPTIYLAAFEPAEIRKNWELIVKSKRYVEIPEVTGVAQ